MNTAVALVTLVIVGLVSAEQNQQVVPPQPVVGSGK